MDESPRSPEDIPNWSPPLAGNLVAKSKPGEARSWHPDGASKTHQGIDLPAPVGTPVQSIGDGKVVYVKKDWFPGADKSQFGGNFIIVEHPNGVRSKYMHLSEIDVKVGDEVKGAQEIGKSGDTGGKRSGDASEPPMAPHLHFAIEDADPKTRKVTKDAAGKTINFDPTKFLKLDTFSNPGQPYGHQGEATPSPKPIPTRPAQGGFLSTLRSFFGFTDKPAEQKTKPFPAEDFGHLRDISRRVIEIERRRGNVIDENNEASEQDLDVQGREALKRARDISEEFKRNTPPPAVDAGARLQQQNNIQRMQKMANDQTRRSEQLVRDIQSRNQLQASLARANMARINEMNARTAQIQRQNMEDAQRRSALRQQEIQRQQDDARRNEELRMAQRRTNEQMQREQQQRMEQQNRMLAAAHVRPPISFPSQFTKPYVSPRFGGNGGPPKPIWLPPHIYTAPAPPPRPPSPPPFSRPNNNVGRLFS
jgi:hypothetical protein